MFWAFAFGFCVGVLSYWRYRQVEKTTALLELSHVAELLETRVHRWGRYWTAIVLYERPLLSEEATEIIDETHEAFLETIGIMRRIL